MRFVELSDELRARRWHLHPRLSVIPADPPTRAAIIGALADAFNGHPGISAGTVDVHGVIMELDSATAALLALDGAVDPIVRARELPGSIPTAQSRAVLRHERDVLRLTERRTELERALADAQRRRALLADRIAHPTVPAEELAEIEANARAEMDRASARLADLERDASELSEARRRLDVERRRIGAEHETAPDLVAAARLEVEHWSEVVRSLTEQLTASSHFEPAEPAVAPDRIGAPELFRRDEALAPTAPVPASLGAVADTGEPFDELAELLVEAELELATAETALTAALAQQRIAAAAAPRTDPESDQRRKELVEALGRLEDADPAPVRAALADYDSQGGGVPDPVAHDLADALERLEERRRGLVARALTGDSHERRAAAAQRLDDARAALAEALRATSRHVVEPAARIEIERMHEQVLEAQEKAERRLFNAKARVHLAELREAEIELLASFGLTSFSDYLLTSSTVGRPDPAAEMRYAIARAEVDDAAHALALVEAGDQPDPELLEIEDEQSRLVDEAVERLGRETHGDLAEALRQLRVVGSVPTDRIEHALAEAGIAVVGSDVAEAARVWLVDREAAEVRRQEIMTELSALGEVTTESAMGEASSGRPVAWPSPSGPDSPSVEVVRHRVQRARDRRDALEAELDRMRAEHVALVGTEPSAATASGSEPTRWPAPSQPAHDLMTPPPSTSAEVAGSEELQRQLNQARADLDRAETDLALAVRSAAAVAAMVGDLEAQWSDLDGRLSALVAQRSELIDEVARATEAHAAIERRQSLPVEEPEPLAEELAAAERDEASARLDLAEMDDEMFSARRSMAEPDPLSDRESEAIEFYLLSRLASQRSVAFVGSVPAVFDDTLVDLPAADIVALLARLDRMTSSIQIVYLTEDPTVLGWAAALRPEQGCVCPAYAQV